MKPEITAPGGSILSVGGAYKGGISDHETYEVMSGTSMAAPQVAGMAALLAQYIRENNLEEQTGLDARTLAQSLLMSTAEPFGDAANGGYYYPVLQQGAGIANIGAAIAADSYILMNEDATESFADGKVKVELGDDPSRDGEYTFTFTLHNRLTIELRYNCDLLICKSKLISCIIVSITSADVLKGFPHKLTSFGIDHRKCTISCASRTKEANCAISSYFNTLVIASRNNSNGLDRKILVKVVNCSSAFAYNCANLTGICDRITSCILKKRTSIVFSAYSTISLEYRVSIKRKRITSLYRDGYVP
jgi:hypothetical protein